jgi:hypothetical protein
VTTPYVPGPAPVAEEPPNPQQIAPDKPRRRRTTAIALSAIAVVLVGAAIVAAALLLPRGGATGSATSADAAVSTPEPAATPVRTTEAATTGPSRRFGERAPANAAGFSADVAVYGYRQPVAVAQVTPDPQGYVWAAADVEVCARAVPSSDDQISVSWLPWSLVYSDGSVVEASQITYAGFPKPAYPVDRIVPVGRCVRGWVVFEAPGGKRPTMVEYQTDAGVLDWMVPQS